MVQSVKLNIPFYRDSGDGNCLQASMASLLEYLTGKKQDLALLDKLTHRKKGKWMMTTQGVKALVEMGLDVKYYTKVDLEPFLRGSAYIRERFPKMADFLMEKLDEKEMVESTRYVIERGLYVKKQLTLSEIEVFIKARKGVILLIDANIINGRAPYHGHYVTVTGFDDLYVYYHDSSIGPNRKAEKTILEKAWHSPYTDSDTIVVGKKGNR